MGGSPPRAWGRLERGPGEPPRPRFTPTCVGKTTFGIHPPRCITVHPHVRGEDKSEIKKVTSYTGSPPRAWGRQYPPVIRTGKLRFTPTCVGKTCPSSNPLTTMPVHPHVRGEDCAVFPISFPYPGSPPRAWGRLFVCKEPTRQTRFTPTCVGKTLRFTGFAARKRASVPPSREPCDWSLPKSGCRSPARSGRCGP